MKWKLKRTVQCAKCPWKVSTNPHDISNGYCETKHKDLEETIAKDLINQSTKINLFLHQE